MSFILVGNIKTILFYTLNLAFLKLILGVYGQRNQTNIMFLGCVFMTSGTLNLKLDLRTINNSK